MRAPTIAAFCGALSSLLFASIANAQDSGGIDAVVVTATRIPTPETQVASSITVVTADEIAAQQLDTVPDLLKEVPGLNVVQTGGPGGQSSVFMRGTNSNHVKVLVDGIDVSDPSSPNDAFDFGQLLTQDIERVEILRGPQSGLYGSDAIGGVINVITKSGNGPAQFTASVEGGSFATFNQSAGVSGSSGDFHYVADFQHYFSGGTPVTPEDLLTASEVRNDDRYDNITASTKLGYDVTDNFDLGLVARYTNTQYYFTGDNFNFFPSIPDAQQSEDSTVQYYTRATAHLVSFGGIFDQTLGVAYSTDHTNDLSPDSGLSVDAGDRVKVDWQGNVRLGEGETLVLGAEDARDEIRFPVSAGNSIASGYAELQSAFGDNFFNAANVRYDDNSRFGRATTFREAPTYLIKETGTKLKASVGTGFKAPQLSEMFENFPSFDFFGNPNLKPEKDVGWDVGFEQNLFDDKFQFGGTYFRNDIHNLIESVEVPSLTFEGINYAPAFTYGNVDKAETDGVESFISWQPISMLTLRGDYTYTEANDETIGQELVRRPKHKASLNALWQATNELSFDTTLLYVGPWLDFTRDVFNAMATAPGYFTANIAVNYDISEHFTVFGRVDNLLDERYQNPIGFEQPGRGFFIGLKAKT